MSSWPASAGPLLPDTGASTNITSGRIAASLAAILVVSSMPIVPICAHTASGANASATWPPKMTDSVISAVGSIVMIARASRTASLGDAATAAPASASGAVTSRDRSQTVVRSPAASRLRGHRRAHDAGAQHRHLVLWVSHESLS